jgi:DNA-binding MarR family transcriptional regulator
MGELFSVRIAKYQITLPMFRVLAALWEQGDQRLGDLASSTTIEISTLSRLIGEMTRRGLTSRSRVKDNGRTLSINLTQHGRMLIGELIPIAVHFEGVSVSKHSEKDIGELKAILEEIYASLDVLENEVVAPSEALDK